MLKTTDCSRLSTSCFFLGIFDEIKSLDWSKLQDLPDDILNSGFAKEGEKLCST